MRRMLAFVEFADSGDPDMSYSIRLARQLHAELILFSVIDTPAMVALIGTHRAASAKRLSRRIVSGLRMTTRTTETSVSGCSTSHPD